MKKNWSNRRLSLLAMLLACTSLTSNVWSAGKHEATLTVGDKEVGKTLRYMGSSHMTYTVDRKTQNKYIKESGLNTTKFWEIFDSIKYRVRHRRYLYGPDLKTTKAIVIRQVKEDLGNIDWALELFGSKKKMEAMARNYAFLKQMGVEPLVNLVVKRRMIEKLDEQILWRWAFLYNVWANKVKKYNFPLWEVGCENDRRHSMLNMVIGAEALREAEKITGVKIRVAASGHHGWKKVTLDQVLEDALTSDSIKHLDALSFHSFAYNLELRMPRVTGYKTYPEWHANLDAIQRKHRKGQAKLPWWDTSWGWAPRAREVETPWGRQHGVKAAAKKSYAYLLTAIEHGSRFLWESQCGMEYSCVYKLFSKEGEDAGMIQLKSDGSLIKTKPYFAVRMVARACANAKERLDVKGVPSGPGIVVLASRDKEHTYLTVVNRHSKGDYELKLTLPSKLKGFPYTVREVSQSKNDEQVAKGNVATSFEMKVAPLAMKQLIINTGSNEKKLLGQR